MEEALAMISDALTYTPHWHVCAVGPAVLGEQRLGIALRVITATREDADEAFPAQIEAFCVANHIAYDEDDWEYDHPIILINGN